MSLLVKMKPDLFYGWWIALAGCGITAVSAGVSFWSFGVFLLPIEREFGWLRAEISVAFSAAWFVQGLLGPLVGRGVDRYGARPLILWGTIATGLCFVLLATTASLWQFYLFHVVHAFCRAWMFYLPLNVLITKWFVRRRSVALALFTLGFPIGGVVFVPLLTFIADTVGWRGGYLICGLVLCAVVLPLTLLVLRSSPEEMGLNPDGDPDQALLGADTAGNPASQSIPQARSGGAGGSVFAPLAQSWTVREVLRIRAFWLLALGFSLTFLTQISFSVHSIPFFVSRGLTTEIAAVVVSSSTAVVGLLRIPFGFAIDRISSVRSVMLLLLVTQSLSLGILLVSVDPIFLWAFVLLWGFTGGGMPLMESALIVRAFGDKNYGAILGTEGLVSTVGTVLGPVLTGMVFDITGSYSSALLASLAVSLVAFGAFVAFRPPVRTI